jgi:hypothetical protein
MFKIGKGKNKEKDIKHTGGTGGGRGQGRSNEKIAKRILGKDTGRRVFGFACSPDIHAKMKMLAGELQVPIFALAEHCLQLSAGSVTSAKENPEERELLHRHLIEIHINQRTIEKFSWYDEELAKELNEERLRRFEIERTVRQIVVDFARRGMKPKDMPLYLDYGYRCFTAAVNDRPVPRAPAPMPWSRKKSQAPDNQPAEDSGDETHESSIDAGE